MAVTLAQLRARSESASDQPASAVSGTVISIIQFNDFVNDGIRELYETIVSVHPDFRVSQQANFTLTNSATNSNALPTDFRSARAVKSDPGTSYEDFLPMFALRSGRGADRRSYRVSGSNVYIEPLYRCQGTYALMYVPVAPTLATDGSTLDSDLEQFQDAIVYHAAMKARAKVEWDVQAIAVLLSGAMARAKTWARTQRSADPPRIEDVRRYGRRAWGTR